MYSVRRLAGRLLRRLSGAVHQASAGKTSKPIFRVALRVEALEHRTLPALILSGPISIVAIPAPGTGFSMPPPALVGAPSTGEPSAPITVSFGPSAPPSDSPPAPVIPKAPLKITRPPTVIRNPNRPRHLALVAAVPAPAEPPTTTAFADPPSELPEKDPVNTAPKSASFTDAAPASTGVAPSAPSDSPLPAAVSPIRVPQSASADERVRASAVETKLASALPTEAALDNLFIELWDQDQMLFPDSAPSIDETLFPDGFPSPDDMTAPGAIPEVFP